MDRGPSRESVDETLQTSVSRVRTSRELLDQIDKRLERGAELLQGSEPTIELGTSVPETD